MSRAAVAWPLIASLWLACARPPEAYPLRAPLWRDPDRRPFAGRPAKRYSPPRWDRVDKSLIRPVSQFFRVRPGGEAINVNDFDEVPDSSWFENRLGLRERDLGALVSGPCREPFPEPGEPWTVVEAKTEGATPGFGLRGPDGNRYLVKVDGPAGGRGLRATLADVVGSRLYHAAGYRVPCNGIVYLDRDRLQIAEDATAEDAYGHDVPLTRQHVEIVLAAAARTEGGLYRAAASRFLPGRPLGPFRYHGMRRDDRNDVVPHEDRRELRGARLLAAWTDHIDQREGNTLSMWREADAGRGYVMHHLIDFGDCFGGVWNVPAQEAWRRSHDYWLNPWGMAADFLTLGLRRRVWDDVELSAYGLLFGYYDVEHFDPEGWKPRIPNPAFGRMTERDGAWMARIVARFDREGLARIIAEADVSPGYASELLRRLWGRRQRLLSRYLSRLSPLADPELHSGAGGPSLCARDLAVTAGVAPAARRYAASLRIGAAQRLAVDVAVDPRSPDGLCAPLRPITADSRPIDWVLQVSTLDPGPDAAPVRFHGYALQGGRHALVAIERLSPSD